MRTGTTTQMSVRRARGLQEYIRDELGSFGLDSSGDSEDERISELYLLQQSRAQVRQALGGVDDAVLREGYLAELQTYLGRNGAYSQSRNQPRNPVERLETINISRGGQARDSIAEEEEFSYFFPGTSQDSQSTSRNRFQFNIEDYFDAVAPARIAGEVGGKKPKNVAPEKKKEEKVKVEQEELPPTFRWVQIEIVDEEKIPDCKRDVKPWHDDDLTI